MEYFAVALAWLVPGAGHFVIGQKARGVIFALAIHFLFWLGVLIGGFHVLNPPDPDKAIWGYAQFATGWPMLLGNSIVKNHPDAPQSWARVEDIGIIYTGIAGMLNLLVIFDVLVRSANLTGTPDEHPNPAPSAPTEPRS